MTADTLLHNTDYEATPRLHGHEYGAAARRLDALWRAATDLENRAEARHWMDEDANESFVQAWRVYDEERHAALPPAQPDAWVIGARHFVAALGD